MNSRVVRVGLLCGVFGVTTIVFAKEAEKEKSPPVVIELAKGRGRLVAPQKWKPVKPRVSLIDYEFKVEPAKGDKRAGRVTIMSATGSIKANIDRWANTQFKYPAGKKREDSVKVKKHEVAGQTIHIVDIVGDYQDRAGPFAGPTVSRPGYRMLGAIVETKSSGNHYVKFYGPEKTVSGQREPFEKMLKGLVWREK